MEENQDDKPHEPTEKKIQDARKKGDLVRSADVNTSFLYLAVLICSIIYIDDVLYRFGDFLSNFLSNSDHLSNQLFIGPAVAIYGKILFGAFSFSILIFSGPIFFVLLSLLVQRNFVFSLDKLTPKISRISPVENAKNKFGASGLFEFAKSATKLSIFSCVLAFLLLAFRDEMVSSVMLTSHQSVSSWQYYCVRLFAWAFGISLIISFFDYLWKRYEFLKKQGMSHKELRDEIKEAEGDPYLKAARRSKAQEAAVNKMLSDVPSADVVVVNPTHYAVVLTWERRNSCAPRCVAKGTDHMAARLREIAQASGVPIFSDPPTARMLFADLEIGQEIETQHYAAVAAAIRFADELRSKKRIPNYDS